MFRGAEYFWLLYASEPHYQRAESSMHHSKYVQVPTCFSLSVHSGPEGFLCHGQGALWI
jgi:hypothetical protein